jgi:hypothetical protein
MPRLRKKTSSKSFSKADAEKAGWSFVNDAPSAVLSVHEAQDVVTVKPASLIAEKYVDRPGATAKLITEQAETLEQLLVQISAFEAHLASREEPEPIVSDFSDEPQTVQLPDGGTISEKEYAAGASEAVIEARAKGQAQAQEEENERVAG